MNITGHLKITSLSPQLLVTNLEQSIRYYQLLGFGISFQYEDFYAAIAKDGFTIHLKLGRPLKEERENKRKNVDLDIVFAVGEIQRLYDAIRDLPVNVIRSLREMPYGREFYLADPDGYLLGFIEQK